MMVDTGNHIVGLLLKQYSAFDKCRVEYNTFVIQNLSGTCLWRKKIPNRENQKFLINAFGNFYQDDIDIIMKRYIHFLKTNRFLGNLYLIMYYMRIKLFTKLYFICKSALHNN